MAARPGRRAVYEAELRRRSLRIAATSTGLVLLAIIVLVPLAPGWEAVKKSFFNATVFTKTFPGLLNAFTLDIAIFAWSLPLIALVGLVVAICRDVQRPALYPLRLFATIYTDVFRGLPVILPISANVQPAKSRRKITSRCPGGNRSISRETRVASALPAGSAAGSAR